MKDKIIKWLGIERYFTKKDKEWREFLGQKDKQIQILHDRFDWFMNEYHTNECVNCHKKILAHYGGFYKNFEGKVFCSNECIDKFKIK